MKSYFDITRFRSEVKNKSFATSDRFEILISPPKCFQGQGDKEQGLLASLYAEQVAFPPLNLYVKQCRIYGPAQQRPISSDYGGDGLSITFLVDRDMKIKQYFDYWMQSIVDPDNHLVAYQEDYRAQIEIRQLDRKDNVVYQCKLKDAFPRSMMQLDLSQQNVSQSHRLMVTFAYHKWTVEQLPQHYVNTAQPDRNALTGDQIRNRH